MRTPVSEDTGPQAQSEVLHDGEKLARFGLLQAAWVAAVAGEFHMPAIAEAP
jgi:hypothetical protein